jgi:hypothetical protein
MRHEAILQKEAVVDIRHYFRGRCGVGGDCVRAVSGAKGVAKESH